MAKLLVNADDFGLHHSVNEAVSEGVARGVINSVSVMANGRALDCALLQQFQQKDVAVGAHLTWVGEPWLSTGLWLADWQQFLTRLVWNRRAFLQALRIETKLQLQTLLDKGIKLSHIDSHQHIHHLPVVWRMVNQLQADYAISRVRVAYTGRPELGRSGVSAQLLATLASHWFDKNQHVYCAGIRHTGHYTPELLAEELRLCAGLDTELIVHPATSNADLQTLYPEWGFDWAKEHAALSSEVFREAVQHHGFSLSRFD